MSADIKHLGADPTDEEILENCFISHDPAIMRKGCADEVLAFFRQQAEMIKTTVVTVSWLTGEFVIMFCIPGTYWPDPTMVVEAFKGCRRGGQKVADGSQK